MSHWYRIADGSPCYELPVKAGTHMRPVTIRDARQLALVPSVTTVLAEAAKPQLVNWQIEQALMAALTLPRAENEPLDAFMARAREDSKQQVVKAASRGTEIHDALEQHYKGGYVSPVDRAFVDPVVELIEKLCGPQQWIAERYFADADNGYGGKVDLHCDAFVIDYKGKDFKPGDEKKQLAYDDHGMQLSAYRAGLGKPNATRINIFFDRTQPGVVRHHVWPEDDDYYERFLCLLQYWKRKNKYWPEQTRQAA